MELYALLIFSIGAIVFVGAFVGIFVGIRRMQGHRSRFDGFFELIARSQGARVYPPSLRGNPDPAIQEDVEVSRGDRATRETPGGH